MSWQDRIDLPLSGVVQLERAEKATLGRHQRMVGSLAGVIAKALGWQSGSVRLLEKAAALHDVGKLGVSPLLLSKPAPLDQDERALVQLHAELGYAWLMSKPRTRLTELAAGISLEHHERFDGHGYPHGKARSAIALPSHIVSVCDAYAALREPRPYKPSLSHAEAIGRLDSERGKDGHAFAPDVLELALKNENALATAFEVGTS